MTFTQLILGGNRGLFCQFKFTLSSGNVLQFKDFFKKIIPTKLNPVKYFSKSNKTHPIKH